MAEARKKAGPAKGSVVETRSLTYLAAGVGVDPYAGNVPTLDPELERLRADEIKANEVEVLPRSEPTIDPALVKARDAEIKRDADRAAGEPAVVEPVKSAPAKKAVPAKKSS